MLWYNFHYFQMRRLDSNEFDHPLLSGITIDRGICHGKPRVRGLRYPVEMLLELLSSGVTFEDVLKDYEDLDREDFLAVLVFAAKLS